MNSTSKAMQIARKLARLSNKFPPSQQKRELVHQWALAIKEQLHARSIYQVRHQTEKPSFGVVGHSVRKA